MYCVVVVKIATGLRRSYCVKDPLTDGGLNIEGKHPTPAFQLLVKLE